MCAAFEWKGKGFRPGREVAAVGEGGLVKAVWAGFARCEILEWWQRKGGLLLDIPADRFAERSEVTGKLVWDGLPGGFVIRGLLDTQGASPLVKVVTRASRKWESEKFQHPRMPVLEAPLFPVLPMEPEADSGLLF